MHVLEAVMLQLGTSLHLGLLIATSSHRNHRLNKSLWGRAGWKESISLLGYWQVGNPLLKHS